MTEKKIYIISLIFCFSLLINFNVKASNSGFNIDLSLNHADWSYNLGEFVEFKVLISDIATTRVEPYHIYYEIGFEKMQPHIKDSILFVNDKSFSFNGGTMKIPGFLRCKMTVKRGKETYIQIATAAFEPEKIKPTVLKPRDFEKYWKNVLAKSREIPLDLKLISLDKKSTETTNYYAISYQDNAYKSRFFGTLTIPKKDGKYPAIIRFPGAGVIPLGGNTAISQKDVITLDLYIHPFYTNMEAGFYENLQKNSLYMNYMFWGVNNRDTYYYNRVITGCVKAVDVIYFLPQFDGDNLAAWGSSQGGALSIITTALDKRIKAIVALCPAMSDFTGYLYGRAGGWPHFFNKDNIGNYNNKQVIDVLSYYDVVNFSKMITVPGFYSWGFNDEVTPPTSFYAAFNTIKAPKEVLIIPKGIHKIYPEQTEKTNNWIFNQFDILK